MPRGIPKNKSENILQKTIDSMKNDDNKVESIVDLDPIDLADSAPQAKEPADSISPAEKISDLKLKYPSRTLEDLRKIDYVNQYESKFPDIKREGYVVSWICNTPGKNYRDIYYKQGYDYIEGAPTVASGYSDISGEDKYAHYAMQIPLEIYEKKQKALQDLNNKMYKHILKPDKKGQEIDGDGMYDPKGREVKSVGKVLIKEQE